MDIEYLNKIPLDVLESMVRKIFNENGECGTCSWHAGFDEIKDQIFPDIFDIESWDINKERFKIECLAEEDGEDHRGSYIFFKDLIKQDK